MSRPSRNMEPSAVGSEQSALVFLGPPMSDTEDLRGNPSWDFAATAAQNHRNPDISRAYNHYHHLSLML